MKQLQLFAILLLYSFVSYAESKVIINEIMASNDRSFIDEQGASPDWIELYNNSDHAVDLENWFLSDNPLNPYKWTFPKITINAGAYIVLLASGEDRFDNNEVHTNFKLSSSGETLVLTNATGDRQDEYSFFNQTKDQSIGRVNHSDQWMNFFPSSPNQLNVLDHIITDLRLNFSHTAGFYTYPIDLSITSQEEGVTIYYTTDGSIPNVDSKVYLDNLRLDFESEEPVDISLISTAEAWQLPAGKTNNYHVIRARAFLGEIPVTKTETATYFIEAKGSDRYSFPVVSLTTDKDHFFDLEKGIYIMGDSGEMFNYERKGRESEVPVHMEYFENDGSLAIKQNLGLRVSGNTSRHYPQKSLKLYARENYGADQIEYPFFGTDYDQIFTRISLRTFDSDWGNTGMSDDLAHAIIKDQVNFDYSQREFVIVFLNGEYWGIHSLRDPHDENFIHQHYQIPMEDINMGNALGHELEIENGNLDNYFDLINYVQQNDIREPAHYQYVTDRVDVSSLQDIIITQLYLANMDWPHHNNRFWQSAATNSKWRWIFFDLDGAFKIALNDNLGLYFQTEFDNASFPEPEDYELILPLMKNQTFLTSFRNKMLRMLNEQFAPSRTIPIMEKMVEELKNEIEEHSLRWNYPHDLTLWEQEIDVTKDFLIARPNYLAGDLIQRLDVPMEIFPNPNSGELYIQLESLADQTASISIVNNTGQVLPLKRTELLSGENQLYAQIPDKFPNGIYTLKVESAHRIFSKKLILMRK